MNELYSSCAKPAWISPIAALLFKIVLLLQIGDPGQALAGLPDSMAEISGGSFTPIVKSAGKVAAARKIAPFLLDRYPVTISQYLDFVKNNPQWQRSRRAPIFAEAGYLSRWKSDLEPGLKSDAPVTEISWFAARAYCRSQNKRLPTAAEWEYAALADETRTDASSDSAFTSRILNWYGASGPADRTIGGFKNVWGVYDLHGLIWEWVEDFNGEFTSGDSRGDNSQDESAFCGGSAINLSDKARREYAAFMRYAFRGSLRGNYTIDTLGFRCSKSS